MASFRWFCAVLLFGAVCATASGGCTYCGDCVETGGAGGTTSTSSSSSTKTSTGTGSTSATGTTTGTTGTGGG